MVKIAPSRELAIQVWKQRLSIFARGPKLPLLNLYCYFTSLFLIGALGGRLVNGSPITFSVIFLCLCLLPALGLCLVLGGWLNARFSLPFGIDDHGLILPVGRVLGWWRPTSCEVLPDPQIPGAYYLTVFHKKRMLCRGLIDDPAKAEPFLTEFRKHYGGGPKLTSTTLIGNQAGSGSAT